MVEIKYCPQCQKAKREHFRKSQFCPFCGSQWESMDVPRSRYFAVMLPFLILGVLIHMYALFYYMSSDAEEISSNNSFLIGLLFLGIGFYIIAIGFQVLDSKMMEKDALKIGTSRFKDKRVGGLPIRGPPKKKEGDKDDEEEEEKPIIPLKMPKILDKDKDEEEDEEKKEKEEKKKEKEEEREEKKRQKVEEREERKKEREEEKQS